MNLINDDLFKDQGCGVCFGNFDGLHIGHRLIINKLKEECNKLNIPSVIFTFNPHPAKYFNREIKLLSTERKRKELFIEQNIDYLIEVEFNGSLSKLTAEDFFQKIIVNKLNAKIIIVGKDYKFGSMRSGDVDLLNKLANKNNIKTIFMNKVSDKAGNEVSSSNIRKLIEIGKVKDVLTLIDRPYSVEGLVIHGNNLGKQLGFPTANIDIKNDIIPFAGVYSSYTKVDNKIYSSMSYIGNRPTFNGSKELRVETNIFDFNKDIYGEFIEIMFLDYIREDKKLKDLEELKKYLENDKKIIKELQKV